jgi:hypothetical protein
MNRFSKTALSVAVFSTLASLSLSTSANAHERWRYETDKRQAKHSDLIREGRRNGSLTFWEAYRLRREQSRIAQLERAYKSDGHFGRNERRAVRYAQDSAAQHIFSQRNDGQVRWWRRLQGY